MQTISTSNQTPNTNALVAANTTASLDHNATQPGQVQYTAPDDPYQDWRGCESSSFVPNRRQQIVMDAAALALDAGLFYNRDVDAHVAETLGVSAEVRARNTVRVEGGNFGYDVYFARNAVEAQRTHVRQKQVASELRLSVGDKLGALVFSDFKRNTGATVEEVSGSGMSIKILAKRGKVTVRATPSPLQLKRAIELAHERGHRKDGYQEFLAARQSVGAVKHKTVQDTTSTGPAPLTTVQLAQLQSDACDPRSAAIRKQITMDSWEEAEERVAAREHFDLGTWLFYHSKRIGRADGLRNRIDCLRRLFEAGIYRPGYRFSTVFDFGERQFDTCVEMGDADEVVEGLRQIALRTQNANLLGAFRYMGWSLEPKQTSLF